MTMRVGYCRKLYASNLLKDGAYSYRSIFVRFVTMREKKKILARAIEIQKEN